MPTLVSDGSEAIGSSGLYNCTGALRVTIFVLRALPARPMARVARAASCNALKLMSSEYAKAVFSPEIARTPTPCSMLKLPDLTMPSSRFQPSDRVYWKYRSA